MRIRLIKQFNKIYGSHFRTLKPNSFIDTMQKIVLVVVKDRLVYMEEQKEVIGYWKEKGYAYVILNFGEFKRKHFEWMSEHIVLHC
ncbi:hypothetical protein J4466_03890 [Candidatus Pacearchaeota archaeon]|nr:hypothetical protein [Candidatus Pacearchaeota archaeon]